MQDLKVMELGALGEDEYCSEHSNFKELIFSNSFREDHLNIEF